MSVYTHGTTRVVLPLGTAITATVPGEPPVDISEYVPVLLDGALRQGVASGRTDVEDVLDGVDVRFECPAEAVITHEGAPVDGQLALVILGRVVTSSLLDLAKSPQSDDSG